jgi:hypothetical protein
LSIWAYPTPEIVRDVSGTVSGITRNGIPSVSSSVVSAPGGTVVDFDRVGITCRNATGLLTLKITYSTTETVTGEPCSSPWAMTSVRNPADSPDDLPGHCEPFQAVQEVLDGIYKNDRFGPENRPAVGAARVCHVLQQQKSTGLYPLGIFSFSEG